jgi:hypothetical protein
MSCARPASAERAQAPTWRWAAAPFASDPSIERVERRRNLLGDSAEGYAVAMQRVAEMPGVCTR